MSSFTRPLVLIEDYEGNPQKPFVLAEYFSYYSDILPTTICIPKGYRTDFASIPRFFWRILPPVGRYGKAAVVHDWLCDVSPKVCDHITAANVFGEAMAVLGVGRVKRTIMVKAVKWFGPKFKKGEV